MKGSTPNSQVAVAVIVDSQGRLLLPFNEKWGDFTLPMTRMRVSAHGPETAEAAALRAAAATLGVPVRLADHAGGRFESYGLSGSSSVTKAYQFHPRRVEPHPAFVNGSRIAGPHFWASPFALLEPGYYEPLSPTVPRLVRYLVAAFGIPERVQPTTTLVLTRTGSTGREFLLRWSESWNAYSFPAQERDLDDSRTSQEQAAALARKELGESAANLPWETPHEIVLDGMPSGRMHSAARDVPTRYLHRIGCVELQANGAVFASNRPLHWASTTELRQLHTGGVKPVPGAPSGKPGSVSGTAVRVAEKLGLLDEDADDELIRQVLERWEATSE